MKLLTGKDEIVCLLKKVVARYEQTTQQEVIRNTNRKNYEGLARTLSEISVRLPVTAAELEHDPYPADPNPGQEYPYRKYDITAGQVKDAYAGIVANPRPFLVEACYIYLYGKGRKGFEKEPTDPDLLRTSGFTPAADTLAAPLQQECEALQQQVMELEQEKKAARQEARERLTAAKKKLGWMAALLTLALCVCLAYLFYGRQQWNTLRSDMKILAYKPTPAEISQVEGVWLCYTGSPQARSSDPNRYHMAVTNVVDIRYRNGYFTFERYGANFDHTGYIQLEAPGIVSIHSFVKDHQGGLEWPRHSLLRLDSNKAFLNSISASWNFDVTGKEEIIGIREVYEKQGKGGKIEEIINTIENSSCRCKIIKWTQENKPQPRFFYLKNYSLDSLPNEAIRRLIDEKSIILRDPREGVLLTDTSKHTER